MQPRRGILWNTSKHLLLRRMVDLSCDDSIHGQSVGLAVDCSFEYEDLTLCGSRRTVWLVAGIVKF